MNDAINYLLHSRESVGGGVEVGGSHLLPLLWTHLRVTFEAIIVSVALTLPIALWLGHKGKGQLAASTAANVGRAVPSFAVLVFASTYLGLNAGNLVFAMVLLAIPPIFTNTYVGVRQVDRDVVDAARGMGLSERQLALRVELPLALPLIFGGIRTSVVNVLATATLGPYVGVDTLGVPIINANVHGDAGRLGTALLVALLAIAAELFFAALQRAVTPRGLKLSQTNTTPSRRNRRMRSRSVLALLLLVLTLGLVACGSDDDNSSGSADTGAAATTTTAPAADSKAHHGQRRERLQADDHRRLQELHRAVHPRGDLRPGAEGRRLQGQEAAQPRLRADRAQGPEGGPRRRLPGVHGHDPDQLLQGQGQGRQPRRRAGLHAGQGLPDQGRHHGARPRRPSPTPTASRSRRRPPRSSATSPSCHSSRTRPPP